MKLIQTMMHWWKEMRRDLMKTGRSREVILKQQGEFKRTKWESEHVDMDTGEKIWKSSEIEFW